MRIKEILKEAEKKLINQNIDDAWLKSRILLAYILKETKEYLVIHDDEELGENKKQKFISLIDKLAKGKPLQYLTNHQEFFGLDFYVDENVLIPQPDTEILVEEALAKIKDKAEGGAQLKILDLCTGSGAIVISLKKKMGSKIVAWGSDISADALEVAKKNANDNEVAVEFVKSDLFDRITDSDFDFIFSNPPYIKTEIIESLSREVQNEPRLALDGGSDGLEFYRRIATEGINHLKNGGHLMLEIGYDQREDVTKILKDSGYVEVYSRKDYSGNDRVVVGKKSK